MATRTLQYCFIIALLVGVCSSAWTAQGYTIQKIDYFTPLALNDSGEVVGWYAPPEDFMKQEARLWSPTKGLVTLPKLWGQTSANGINDKGQVVGDSYISNGDLRAVKWDADRTIHDLPKSGIFIANDINNSGNIVGGGSASGSRARVIYANGKVVDLMPFGDWKETWGTAINERNQVSGLVGSSSGGLRTPVVWDADAKVRTLDTLGENENFTNDINDAGVVVGGCRNAKRLMQAVVWSADGKVTNLGWQGQAQSINNNGVVVGWDRGGRADGRAMIWQNGVSTDLNTLVYGASEWKALTGALCINDKGQIMGTGTLANGEKSIFLLTPIQSAPRSSR